MKNEKLALWIGVIMLLLGTPTGLWPYSYYILLRWVITAVAIFVAYSIWQKETKKLKVWAYILVVVAIVFNPIAPLYMTKEGWVPIDVLVAILFATISISFRKLSKSI